jgi:hypothetical protein
MNNRQQPQSEARRSFLRNAALTCTAAGVVTSLPGTALAAPEEAERPQAEKGYRLTRHVLDYYKSVSE